MPNPSGCSQRDAVTRQVRRNAPPFVKSGPKGVTVGRRERRDGTWKRGGVGGEISNNNRNKTDKGLKTPARSAGGAGTPPGPFPSAIMKRIPQDFSSKGNAGAQSPVASPAEQPHRRAAPPARRWRRRHERALAVPRSRGPGVG